MPRPPAARPDDGWVPVSLARRLTRAQVIALSMACVTAIGIAAAWWLWSRTVATPPSVRVIATGSPVSTPSTSPGTRSGAAVPAPAASTTMAPMVVHVMGRVRRPGVVRLWQGSRVADAIAAAGGLRPGTKGLTLNLARVLADGEQVIVEPGQTGSPPTTPTAGVSAGAELIDLNTATVDDLDSLPGVGPVLAQRIIDWREAHGRFTSVDELGEVTGVGDRRLADIAPKVRV